MFMVNEITNFTRRRSSKAYSAVLYIEEAYDKVNSRILYKFLEEVGMNEKVVKIIKSMYEKRPAIKGRETSRQIVECRRCQARMCAVIITVWRVLPR